MKFKKLFITLFLIIFIVLYSFPSYCTSKEELNITAGAAVLMDSKTGKLLYDKNADEKMYPASTTKIVTAILTIENCELNELVIVPYEALAIIPSGYAIAALQVGEQLTVSQLLQVMMVHSANDAANVLAYHISGSIENFAILMNDKISELGLTNTHFTNPSGKHDENHYTTANDLAKIMQYCMSNNTFREYAGLKHCNIPATNKYEQRVFSNTNELLTASNYFYEYAIAGKTGYTTEAKNCLVSVANKNGLELISVILSVGIYSDNTSAKFVETKLLFEYGFENYTMRKLRDSDSCIEQIEISNGTKDTRNLDLLLTNDINVLINQSDLKTEFSPEINVDDNLKAPISQGQIVGKVYYTIDEITYSADLKASHDVEKSNFLSLMIKVFLILIILFILHRLLFDNNGNNRNKKYKKYKKRNKKYSYDRF